MAQNEKELIVRLNGEVGKGINSLSDSLYQIGALLDQVGSKSREFEKESLGVYQAYEDNMLAAKFALSSQYESASQLARVMDTLHDSAQGWAASTLFTTSDVSKAINEAAHAGWDLEEIMEGIPQAIKIALAGSMDLSTGLDYLIKMTNSTGTEFDEIGTLVDQWAMAANSSTTSIQEMGEAFMALGSAAQFGDNTAELFTMLGVLADVGTTGSEAGTALRNAMMRLVGPTTKAEAAMDLLGIDAEELGTVLNDTNVTKAAKTLEGLGWSAYEDGKLKSVKDIFSDLFTLTENLDEATRNEVISAIFPTRTIATALALMDASEEKIDNLYAKINGSSGYASLGEEIMTSGLTGSLGQLNSKWEEFKRSTGEMLSPAVINVANALGGMVDKLNNLDDTQLAGLTSLLTSLSVAGPLMLGAGAVTKMVGALGVKGTLITTAALGVGYMVGYLMELNKEQKNGYFGNLEMNLETLGQAIDRVRTKWESQNEDFLRFSAAAEESQNKYLDALSSFSEATLIEVLTGGEFTQEDHDKLAGLGEKAQKAVVEGLQNSHAADLSILDAIFGNPQSEGEAESFAGGVALLGHWYEGSYEEALQVGETIRNKLTEALLNKDLTTEDRQAIQVQLDRINQIVSEVSMGMAEAERNSALYAASRVSRESLDSYLEYIEESRLSSRSSTNSAYATLYGHMEHAWNKAREAGETSIEYNGITYDIEDVDSFADTKLGKEISRKNDADLSTVDRDHAIFAATAIENAMIDSGFADAWAIMENAYDEYGGIPTTIEGTTDWAKLFPGMNRDAVHNLNDQFSAMTDMKSYFLKELDPYVRAGDDAAYRLARIMEIGSGANWAANAISFAGEDGFTWGENGLEAPVIMEIDDTAIQEFEPPEYETKLRVIPYVGSTLASGAGGYSGLTGGSRLGTLANNLLYAEGGRAVEASIFGEAGPEWAIPEAHTDRTAELLNAAREASGFSWGDLISRNGGLNSHPGGTTVNVHYAPSITSSDPGSVQSVLMKDKDKLVRMVRDAIDDAKYRDGVEAFA